MHHGLIPGSAAIAILATLIAQGATHRADGASLAEVRQNGILRLCANPSALPYSNLTDRGGLAGFKVELAEVLAHEMGFELGVTWVRNAGDIKNSDCDVLMDVVASAASYDREGLTGPLTTHLPLRYSRPYADSGVVLVISSRSSVRRLEDLHGQKIGVMVGTVEHEWLAKHGFRVSVFASQEDIIAAIEAGEIEVGATNPVIVGWYRHEHPSTAVRIPDGYEPEPALRWSVSVGLRRADDALLAAVDAAVSRVCRAADTSADLREVWHYLSTPFRRRSTVRMQSLVRLTLRPLLYPHGASKARCLDVKASAHGQEAALCY